MKLGTTTMVAGIAVLASVTARAQMPVRNAGTPAPLPATVPATIPDFDETVSPKAPLQPGEVPAMANADGFPPPSPIINPVLVPVPAAYQPEGTPSYMGVVYKVGAAVMLGGGFQDFTQSSLRSVTGGGASWNARLAAGTRQFVGLEAAYAGSYRTVQTLGIANDSNLTSNGLEGTLRGNIPIVRGGTLIEPFGFVGLGWQHYRLAQAVTTADVTRSDNIMTLPVGGGLMVSYDMVMIDARFTWTDTFNNNLFPTEGGKLNTWGVGGNMGIEF
jgi:hypothetical protein